jgi:carboxyl-terminal processing protease
MRWFHFIAAAGIVVGLAAPAFAQSSIKTTAVESSTSEGTLAEAEAAEKDGKPEKALELCLKLYIGGNHDAQLRDRIRGLFRKVNQIERLRDSAFLDYVVSLKTTESLALYTEALTKIHAHYADRTKATFDKLYAAGLTEVERAMNDPLFRERNFPKAAPSKISAFLITLRDQQAKLPATAKDCTNAARDLTAAATRQLGLSNGSVIILELLCGACSGLDEFSQFHHGTASASVEIVSPLVEFLRYGLVVKLEPNSIEIEQVLPQSWAALHTKLQRGDRILRFNETSMSMLSSARLVALMRASMGSSYTLELDSTDEPVSLPTPLPTVYGVNMLNEKAGIGYARMSHFQPNTPTELDDAIRELKSRGMKALILDIRGNSGGLLTTAIDVAKRFLPQGLIVTTQGQTTDFANRVFSSDAGMQAHEFPVVLLIDAKTMSAAEILAAGLKDHQRAKLVGQPTFGKGQVQAPIRLTALDGTDKPSGSLLLTVATLFGPQGGALNMGVTPHFTETVAERQLQTALRVALESVTK